MDFQYTDQSEDRCILFVLMSAFQYPRAIYPRPIVVRGWNISSMKPLLMVDGESTTISSILVSYHLLQDLVQIVTGY